MRLSAAVRVYRTASHERSPPPRLRSDRRVRSLPISLTGDIPLGGHSYIGYYVEECPPPQGRGVSPPIRSTGRFEEPLPLAPPGTGSRARIRCRNYVAGY